jgi:vancomycin permeability regulator SanA
MNWTSKRAVLGLIGAVCAVVFVAGMVAAWNNRHHTICRDGKAPVRQRGGILGQTVYQCHDGQVVTTPG